MSEEEQLKQGEERFTEILDSIKSIKGIQYAIAIKVVAEFTSFRMLLQAHDAPPEVCEVFGVIFRNLIRYVLTVEHDAAKDKPTHEKFSKEFYHNIQAIHEAMIVTIRKEKK